eukprot:Em0018g679a
MNKLAARTCIISIAILVVVVVVVEYYHVSYGVLPSLHPENLRTDDVQQSSPPSGVTEQQVQRQPNSTDSGDGGATQEATLATLISRNRATGQLNYDIWKLIVGFLVDDLRIKRDFPHKPTTRSTADSLKVVFNEYAGDSHHLGMYGHRMYGVLYPPTTGEYSFIVELTQVSCACSVEFWLSTDTDPRNSRKLLAAEVPFMISRDVPAARISDVVRLNSNSAYYFEFLEKAFNGMVVSDVKWRTPLENKFISIPPSSFAAAAEFDKATGQYLESPMATALLGPLPTLVLQSHRRTNFVGDTVFPITPIDVLPLCEFKPEYVSKHHVPLYHGIYEVFDSTVYPPDETWFRKGTNPDTGNTAIDQQVASNVIELYKKAFEGAKIGGEVVGLHYMEQTKNKGSGSRFLLEMDIKLKDGLVHTSEFVYLPNDNKLCHLSNFQWTPNVDVYLVVSLKNLGEWVKHLCNNLEDLYAQTHDDHFELVVVDYDSQDMDVESIMKNSALKRWKYIKKSGPFSRSGGLQAGIDYVTNPNSVVMAIDMHLTLPVGYVEYIRRHTVQGKMGYAPQFFRLDPGFTEININGFWEYNTYGIFALYKSDWTVVGGFDVVKYTTKWGGEDWELLDRTVAKGIEMYRLRHPGLMHYFHTRSGLWDNAKT